MHRHLRQYCADADAGGNQDVTEGVSRGRCGVLVIPAYSYRSPLVTLMWVKRKPGSRGLRRCAGASAPVRLPRGGLIEINVTAAKTLQITASLQAIWKKSMISRNRVRRLGAVTAIPLLLALFAVPGRAAAQDDGGDVAAGHRLADTWCASCHMVDPALQHGSDNGAPAFSAVAAMPSTTPLALHAFLQTPHAQMPDLHLSRDEIDDLTGYILSLRRK